MLSHLAHANQLRRLEVHLARDWLHHLTVRGLVGRDATADSRRQIERFLTTGTTSEEFFSLEAFSHRGPAVGHAELAWGSNHLICWVVVPWSLEKRHILTVSAA